MRIIPHATKKDLILRNGPQDRVSKDARKTLQRRSRALFSRLSAWPRLALVAARERRMRPTALVKQVFAGGLAGLAMMVFLGEGIVMSSPAQAQQKTVVV